MPFTFHVNGIERSEFVRYRSLQIRKDGGTESARLEFVDRDTRAETFQVYDGDSLLIRRDGGLEFGGAVVSVKVQRIDGTTGGLTVTTVDAQGWRFEADDIVISAAFPSQPLRQTVEALRAAYMSAKGWTTTDPLSGGPVLPKLEFTRQSIAVIYDQLQKHSGWPWRVNGDRIQGFVEPGSLVHGVSFTDTPPSVVLRGLYWSRDRLRYSTRLVVTTGGTGDVAHTDTHTGNGTVRQFPLSVFPHPERPPTQVKEGGITHELGGGRWTYDANDATVKATTPVAAGAAVTVEYLVTLPVTVRVYDPSTRLPDGTWNYATVIDAQLTASEQTSIDQAKAWAVAELASRQLNPKRIEIATFEPGIYPWLRAIVSFPNRDIVGHYLIQSTLLTSTGNHRDAVTTWQGLEGDAIGRFWTAYFRERSSSSGGGSSVATGGGAPPSTGGGGVAALPTGTTFRLAGDNITPYGIGTGWDSAPQACPTQLGGVGMAGTWILRVPMYQLTAGTLEVRLFDQTTGGVLAQVSTTAVGERLIGPFAFPTASFAAPTDVHDCLLQFRVTAGTRQVVIGHATVVKA